MRSAMTTASTSSASAWAASSTQFVFAREAIGGTASALEGNVGQVWTQVYGILATIAWCAIATFVIPARHPRGDGTARLEPVEIEGLDYGLHETVPLNAVGGRSPPADTRTRHRPGALAASGLCYIPTRIRVA